jgi:very-short-patch-repair endonuclease
VVVARDQRVGELVGVEVHRPTERADLLPTVRDGIAVTNPVRMLCDLAAVDPRGVAAAVEHVVIAGLVLPTGLRALVERHVRPGHTGIAALRRVVRAWPLGEKPADSVLEPAMAKLLADHGLPPAEFHPTVEGVEVDFRIAGTPVVVECDGWEFHVTSQTHFALDRERDAVLSAAGYAVVHVTWEHVVRRAGATARRLEAVIRRWSPNTLDGAPSTVRSVAGPHPQHREDDSERRSA